MIKVGKIGKANAAANRKLKKMFMDKGITTCEFCGADNYLGFAHRHKRVWYRQNLDLLSDFRQVLLLCQKDHDMIEYSQERTEHLFVSLRGPEGLIWK